MRRALAATKVLERLGPVRAAYVFGSHLEGRAYRWSDIDVAAFVDGVESWDLRRRARAVVQVQREAGLDIEAHLFPSSVFDKPEPGTFAAYVKQEGVCILGDGMTAK